MKDVEECHNEIERWHKFALQSFTAYQALRIATAPNKVGRETAQENSDAIKKYYDAFLAFQNASRIASFSNLTKIFIGYQNSKTGKTALSLDFLLQELEKAQNLPNFDKEYAAQLKRSLKYSEKVKELRKLRNQQIAHIDLSPDSVSFSDKHFKNLLGLSNKILMFSNWCINGGEQTGKYYETVSNHIDMDVSALLNTLKVAQAYPDEFNNIANKYWQDH